MEVLLRFLLSQSRLRYAGLRIEDLQQAEAPLPISFGDRIGRLARFRDRGIAQDPKFAQRALQRIVGATCEVSTGLLIVFAWNDGFDTSMMTLVSSFAKPPCSACFFLLFE